MAPRTLYLDNTPLLYAYTTLARPFPLSQKVPPRVPNQKETTMWHDGAAPSYYSYCTACGDAPADCGEPVLSARAFAVRLM